MNGKIRRPLNVILALALLMSTTVSLGGNEKPAAQLTVQGPQVLELQATPSSDGKNSLQVLAGSIDDDPEQTAQTLAFLKDDLENVKKENPQVQTSVIIGDPDSKDVVTPEDVAEAQDLDKIPLVLAPTDNAKITKHFRLPAGWSKFSDKISLALQPAKTKADTFIQKHYRIAWTLARVAINGLVTMWELTAIYHMPVVLALGIGFGITGVGSGSIQYFSKAYTRILSNLIKTNPPVIGKLATYDLSEILFYVPFFIALIATGHSPDPTISTTLWNLLFMSTFLSTPSQGLWEASVAEDSADARAKKSMTEEQIAYRQSTNYMIGSAIAVAAAVAKLAHSPISYVGFALLTAGGLRRLARVKGWNRQRINDWVKRTYRKISCEYLGWI